jgi:DNA-binding transcriptional MerR regulator
MGQEVFTSAETSRITGLSARRLQYWDKTDLAHPSILRARGQGSRRLYSKQDLFQLRVVKGILDAGISVQSVRRSLAFLRKLLNGKHTLDNLILVSDGRSIYAYRDNDTILDTLHAGQTVFRLALGELSEEMKHQIDHTASLTGKPTTESR